MKTFQVYNTNQNNNIFNTTYNNKNFFNSQIINPTNSKLNNPFINNNNLGNLYITESK